MSVRPDWKRTTKKNQRKRLARDWIETPRMSMKKEWKGPAQIKGRDWQDERKDNRPTAKA